MNRNSNRSAGRQVKSAVVNTVSNALAGVANSYIPGSGAVVEAVIDSVAGEDERGAQQKSHAYKVGKLHAGHRSEAESIMGAPVAMNYRMPRSLPKLTSSVGKDGRMTVRNSELFVDPFLGNPLFEITEFEVNPGLRSFKWLSQIANAYEEYRWTRLEFHYVPSGATTITAGQVLMAIDYDPDDSPPSTLEAMTTYQTFSEARAWSRSAITCSASMMHETMRFHKVRRGPVANTRRFNDCCQFLLASAGAPASALGLIWVSYDVEFKSPATSKAIRVPVGQIYGSLDQRTVVGNDDKSILPGAAGEVIFNGLTKASFDLTDQFSHAGSFTRYYQLPQSFYRLRLFCQSNGTVLAGPQSGFIGLQVIRRPDANGAPNPSIYNIVRDAIHEVEANSPGPKGLRIDTVIEEPEDLGGWYTVVLQNALDGNYVFDQDTGDNNQFTIVSL